MIINAEFKEENHSLNADFGTVYYADGNSQGGGITVDQTYNPESENAQSGKALNPILQNKLGFWKPNTEYKVGDTVLAEVFLLTYGKGIPYLYYMQCKEEHISGNTSSDFLNPTLWNYHLVNAYTSRSTYADSEGNLIVDTYATKEEVGNIETALDSIITIQNELIGGGNA